jgi:hypothetical protein
MGVRTHVSILAALLMGACLGAQSSSAWPVGAPPAAAETSGLVQSIGWDCGSSGCRLRPRQGGIRITWRQSAQEFLAQITPYLNCCHPSTVPFLGYSYGPEIAFNYAHRTSIVSRAGPHSPWPRPAQWFSATAGAGSTSGTSY